MIDDLLPEPLIRVERDGRIAHLNRAAREMFGVLSPRPGQPFESFMTTGDGRLDHWLDDRRRSVEMLPGRLQWVGPEGLESVAVEAGRVPGDDGTVLVRFRGEGSVYHRILQLTQEIEERRSAMARRDEILADLQRRTEELQDLARIDALTGLANRGEFDSMLAMEWGRARRMSRPVALILLDLDHFKDVNDRWGHATGDDVLAAFGRFLDDCTRRATDFVARYGGEEFAILLSETTLPEALRTVNGIVSQTRELEVPGPEGTIRLTVSAGVAYQVPKSDNPRELIEAADQALYRAKESGRDQWLLEEGSDFGQHSLDLIG